LNSIIYIILIAVILVIFLPKIPGMVGAAKSSSKVSVKNGEVDIDVSGKGACACANGICKGDCSDGSTSSTSKMCACVNDQCTGDCDDMIDPENFDPFEWVKQQMK
jgi:hypothetical protein